MRIGLLGGTFDPIHYGHLILADCCRQQRQLDRVLFMPAAIPPHKQGRPLAPGNDRAAMIEAAIADNPAFAVSRYELDRGGVNYSVDTVEHLRQQFPGDELFFLMGADMLMDLPHWHEASRLCTLTTPIVARRAGAVPLDFSVLHPTATAEQVERIRANQVEMPEIGISSSEIRRRVATGLSVRYWTPPAVERYICIHKVYCRQ